MKELGRYSFDELLEVIGSSRSDVGGGTAALLAAAMGASLHAMACSVTLKRGHSTDVAELEALRAQATSVAASLLELAQEDGESFGKVLEARHLPRATAEEAATRESAIQAALRHAVELPLQAARVCCEQMLSAEKLRSLCVRPAHSDINGGVVLLSCGVNGSLFNVWQNCASLEDSQELLAMADDLKGVCSRIIGELQALNGVQSGIRE